MRAWSRRRFLRGAGAALALPLLDGAQAPWARPASFPKRLVIVFTPNGTIKSAWDPTGSEESFTLGPILAPLAPHAADLLVVGGVDVESSYHGPGDGIHTSGMTHLLTGIEAVDVGIGAWWGGGISVDQRIAQAVGAGTRLRSLELAVEPCEANGRTRLSYLGAAQPVPPMNRPEAVYARVFDDVAPSRLAQRKSVLDAVGEDYGALAGRLGSEDRRKVEAHLDAVREVELRLSKGAACAAERPVDPAADDVPANGKLMMDLLVRALACDLTRVVTLQWAPAASNLTFPWLGISTPHHVLSHAPPKDMVVHDQLVAINHWYAEQFAYLLAAMKAVPEGGGTLLDHSVVVWCNELGDGMLHARRDVPFVLAGRCRGALATGRWLQFGGAKAGATHNDLLIALCHAMDVPVATFGNPEYCSGPLPGILR